MTVIIDWKFVAALCAGVSFIMLAYKVDSETAGRVLTQTVDAQRDYAIAISNR